MPQIKWVELREACYVSFASLTEEQQKIWHGEVCMCCKEPTMATGIITCISDDIKYNMPPWGATAAQREFIEELRHQEGTNFDFPVCELHSKGMAFQ